MNIGKYEIEGEIGRGGFGTVYRAKDTILNREVALKVLKPAWLDDRTAVERFYREAQAAAQLDHPNIVTIFDMGELEGRLFIAMRLIDGEPLNAYIKRVGPLPLEQALPIIDNIASALEYAHSQGMVHRDVKPANILIRKDGVALLTDFGLVRGAEQASLVSLNSSGNAMGTPEYIAPEVWDGQPATPASDVYAFACVIYEMLTGTVLYAASSAPAVMRRHFVPPDLSMIVNPNVREALQASLVSSPINRPEPAQQVLKLRQTLTLKPIKLPSPAPLPDVEAEPLYERAPVPALNEVANTGVLMEGVSQVQPKRESLPASTPAHIQTQLSHTNRVWLLAPSLSILILIAIAYVAIIMPSLQTPSSAVRTDILTFTATASWSSTPTLTSTYTASRVYGATVTVASANIRPLNKTATAIAASAQIPPLNKTATAIAQALVATATPIPVSTRTSKPTYTISVDGSPSDWQSADVIYIPDAEGNLVDLDGVNDPQAAKWIDVKDVRVLTQGEYLYVLMEMYADIRPNDPDTGLTGYAISLMSKADQQATPIISLHYVVMQGFDWLMYDGNRNVRQDPAQVRVAYQGRYVEIGLPLSEIRQVLPKSVYMNYYTSRNVQFNADQFPHVFSYRQGNWNYFAFTQVLH